MIEIKDKISSLLFCVLIGVVAILQLFIDFKEIGRFRVADIFVDTFWTPVKRAQKITSVSKKVEMLLQKVEKEQYYTNIDSLKISLDSIELFVMELKNNIVVINRFVSDSQNNRLYLTDSLLKTISFLKTTEEICIIEKGLKIISNLHRDIKDWLKKEKTLFLSFRYILRAIAKETFFNKNYLRSFEKELENNSPIVKKGRRTIQLVRLLLFNDYGEKIFTAKNWFFYTPAVKYLYRPSVIDKRAKKVDFNDKAITEDPVEVILDFKRQLKNRGIDLIVVIVPIKAGIYPQILNDRIKSDNKYLITPTTSIIEELRINNVSVVDLYDAFLEAKKEDTLYGDSLYLCKDTHWKARAISIAAKKVADEIKKFPWFTETFEKHYYTLDTVHVYRKGDLTLMLDLLNIGLPKIREIYKPELTKCLQVVYSISKDDTVQQKKIYKDDFRKSRILLLGDSFSRIYQTDTPRGAGFIAHIAYELSEPLFSIVSDGGASTLVREKLSRNKAILNGKRVVIWEFVERDLRFGEDGWKKIKIF